MGSSSITSLLLACGIFRWQDYFEIIFFGFLVYLVSHWLVQHASKKLLVTFYGYCSCIIIAHFLDLATIQSILVTAAPVTAMLMILMHQQMIQKNFIVAQRIEANQNNQSWIEALTQSCLTCSSENRDIYGIIQRNDEISAYLSSKCVINTPAHKELLLIVMQSAHFIPDQLIWLRWSGILVGTNCTLQPLQDHVLTEKLNSLTNWQKSAIALTAKTDALIFKRDHITNSFSIIINGSLAENISTYQFVKMMYDYCDRSSFSPKETLNDQKKSSNRPNSPYS